MLHRVLAIALVFVGATANAQNPDDVKTLLNALKGNVISLRAPYSADNLQFNVDSTLKKPSKTNGWMAWGFVYVDDAKLKTNRIHIRGSRCLLVFDKTHGKVFAGKWNRPVSIDIDL